MSCGSPIPLFSEAPQVEAFPASLPGASSTEDSALGVLPLGRQFYFLLEGAGRGGGRDGRAHFPPSLPAFLVESLIFFSFSDNNLIILTCF